MEKDFKISVATELDIDNIVRLEQEYPFEQYSKNIILDSIKNSNYINLVAYEGREVKGYLSASIQFEDCDLLKIIVCSSSRRCGYGRMLMSKLIQCLNERCVDNIFLEVRKDNVVAIKFYKSIGFQKINERQKYYGDGVDAEIYRLGLNV